MPLAFVDLAANDCYAIVAEQNEGTASCRELAFGLVESGDQSPK